MNIRDVRESDCSRCLEIYNYYIENSCYTLEFDPLTEDQFLERIRTISAKFPYIVCEDEGRVVGYAYIDPFGPRKGYRFTTDVAIYADKDCRRKGVGEALMTEIFRRAAILGIRDIISVVTAENPASLAFHAKMGFKRVALLEGVADKFGKRFDVIYMQKRIQ